MQKKTTNATFSHARALDAAYRATRYMVDWPGFPGGSLAIRIGDLHPLLDLWLDEVAVDYWCYLTAENPGSRRLSAGHNADRTLALQRWLGKSDRPFLGGESIADTGGWPAETSFLIGGLDRAEVAMLAARWEQNAVVEGRRGAVARLTWLARTDQADVTMAADEYYNGKMSPGRRFLQEKK